jgi:hypothetical protein
VLDFLIQDNIIPGYYLLFIIYYYSNNLSISKEREDTIISRSSVLVCSIFLTAPLMTKMASSLEGRIAMSPR